MEKMKTLAIVTAGGHGLRLPGEVRKQFRLLGGKPLLAWAVEPFLNLGCVEEIIVTLPAAELEQFPKLLDIYFPARPPHLPIRCCAGGAQRQDSVFAALKLSSQDHKLAIIHDGVRPFVSSKLIRELLALTWEYGAAVPGAPVKNTIKTIRDDIIGHTIRRDILLQVYTPQVFDYNIIQKCYHRAMTEGYYSTDDAALLEHYGYSVHYLTDDSFNLKITDEFDLYLAEQALAYDQRSRKEQSCEAAD